MVGMGGFGGLVGDARNGRPPVSGKPPMAGGGAPFTGSGSNGPSATPAAPKPAPSMPYGQANDPGAYGAPGAPGSSPLGMWQSWLNTMGPYLAMQPNSQPGADSQGTGSLNSVATGLSSLAPSPVSTGTAGYYGAGVGPQFDNRGFRSLNALA